MFSAYKESTAFGTKVIIDAFENIGVLILEHYVTGGIVEKDGKK